MTGIEFKYVPAAARVVIKVSVAWYDCGDIGLKKGIICTNELTKTPEGKPNTQCHNGNASKSYGNILLEEACEQSSIDPIFASAKRAAKR